VDDSVQSIRFPGVVVQRTKPFSLEAGWRRTRAFGPGRANEYVKSRSPPKLSADLAGGSMPNPGPPTKLHPP